jgi:phage repressor protein C with HTH and peptisase S24 domain
MDFWTRVKAALNTTGNTQEWLAGQIGANINTYRGWVSKSRLPDIIEAGKIADVLMVSLDSLAGREYLAPSGRTVNTEHFDIAPLVPQKVSAGAGQELVSMAGGAFLPFTNDELIRRAPYPSTWGKGLLAVEVRGDSMTGVKIHDGDIVYFKPGETRGDGLYVLQINGTVLVKRVAFDPTKMSITISSENDRYPAITESADSQAISLLGKVRGWLHEHRY